MSYLFSPLTIREVVLRNRIVVSPMCEYSATDGLPNNWHLVHLGSRAVGGAGLIITEATAVVPEGRISLGDLGIWNNEQVTAFSNITQFIHAQGAVAGIQLAHAGRKASTTLPWNGNKRIPENEGGWKVKAPSALPFSPEYPFPEAMTVEEIKDTVAAFRVAAERALQAGFKVVELHAAHGYLLHQFLSPLSNIRTDEYGGSFDNRTRLLREVTAAVRKVWPAGLPLFVRISATDWAEGGWTEDDSIRLAAILKELGADVIDCSSGGNVLKVKIPVGPLYQLPFATAIRNAAGIRTGAVGMITTAQQAEDIIAKKQADLVFMARQLLRDPYFPLHAARELGDNLTWPVQYQRAKPAE
ncbi:NADPH dehydrogenase NamA [Deminuibacter soli]|uniref:NADPH dehydrogenase NamA n=1 Tax=Deminuibacter soli TaxID=2291815 RepID=A0A3E1NJR6_9BACT|nr:NADPH dehydrogenase NamA [Deminuibacter soli]RFM28169.1 NADPH dehydrogenase NamA [Deminuibacter soli]